MVWHSDKKSFNKWKRKGYARVSGKMECKYFNDIIEKGVLWDLIL